MTAKRKILIVEDVGLVHEAYRLKLTGQLGEEGAREVEFLHAFTVKEAKRLFNLNPDLVAVVMDACVPGEKPTTLNLARQMRKSGFRGPMIAASSVPLFRDKLRRAGCDLHADKAEVPARLCEVLRRLENAEKGGGDEEKTG